MRPGTCARMRPCGGELRMEVHELRHVIHEDAKALDMYIKAGGSLTYLKVSD